jgi:O-acetyl-ADP-ribose deacetylase (regulator of RNase III)
MIAPGPIRFENHFFEMNAILQQVTLYKEKIHKVYCPGLGTGTGLVDPELAAKEMANAYKKWLLRN